MSPRSTPTFSSSPDTGLPTSTTIDGSIKQPSASPERSDFGDAENWLDVTWLGSGVLWPCTVVLIHGLTPASDRTTSGRTHRRDLIANRDLIENIRQSSLTAKLPSVLLLDRTHGSGRLIGGRASQIAGTLVVVCVLEGAHA